MEIISPHLNIPCPLSYMLSFLKVDAWLEASRIKCDLTVTHSKFLLFSSLVKSSEGMSIPSSSAHRCGADPHKGFLSHLVLYFKENITRVRVKRRKKLGREGGHFKR